MSSQVIHSSPPASPAALADLVLRLGQPRVLVIGDVMLDRYVWGNAERISQEAPVILLRADQREERPGGASNVANLLRTLGARVALAGVIGRGSDGDSLRRLLVEQGIDDQAVLTDPDRPTTVKERYMGRAQQRHLQQMLRVDYEDCSSLNPHIEEELTRVIRQQMALADIVLISDYDKGVCTPGLLASVLGCARAQGLRTLVDPIRGLNYQKYHGASAITPNRLEAGLASGRTLHSISEAQAAAQQLRELLDLEAAIVTLDREGMVLNHRDGRADLFPTRPRQVYDITGAGDMVLAMLGMVLACGADYGAAIALANVAGGLEVERVGVAPITPDEILRDLLMAERAGGKVAGKLRSRADLVREVQARRSLGQRVVFTNGCFDVLHAGHVQYLQEARAQGDLLVVGLNSDSSVRALKGPTRPVHAAEARAAVLEGLESVDFITLFDEGTPLELIQELRPDVLVKGADYRLDEIVGADVVEAHGGRVHLAAVRPGFSTSHILQQLGAA
jgi:D-beta-D-heptose 7-phosphate kinase/D-beta-D-heptose 1-phosphate adenosyltransferase